MNNLEIVRAKDPSKNMYFVFTKSYARNWELVNLIASTLKSDFPAIEDREIEIREFENIFNNRIYAAVYSPIKDVYPLSLYQTMCRDYLQLRI